MSARSRHRHRVFLVGNMFTSRLMGTNAYAAPNLDPKMRLPRTSCRSIGPRRSMMTEKSNWTTPAKVIVDLVSHHQRE